MLYLVTMNTHYYEKIARLLLHAVHLQPGDKIMLSIEADCREAARHVTAQAYAGGAAYVDISYNDNFLHAEAIKNGPEEFFFPAYLEARLKESCRPGWKAVAILSGAEDDAFEGLPGERAAAYFKAAAKLKEIKLKALMANTIPWTLTFLPSEGMAGKTFPDLSPDNAVAKYWEEIIRIMRLDHHDPVAFWDAKMEKDRLRSDYMNNLNAEYLTFKGPGTDFRIGLNRQARWIGGYDHALTGERFMSNIPTAEIFTSPDWRVAEGRVSLTRPFVMTRNLGPVPEGAWFEFKEGRVVDYGADSGRESLDNLFATDERARYLGEVALVDPRSPFAESGVTFYNGLYDENAACHLALGKAYPFTLREQQDFSDQELREIGMNTAQVHEDMMIGSRNVDVTAHTEDGREIPLIKDGAFLI